MFEKSPALSCRASARHPFQEIPRFTRDDKKEGRDDRKRAGVFENIRRRIDGLSYEMPCIRSMASRKRLLLRALFWACILLTIGNFRTHPVKIGSLQGIFIATMHRSNFVDYIRCGKTVNDWHSCHFSSVAFHKIFSHDGVYVPIATFY